MRSIIVLFMLLSLPGCGALAMPDDHITEITRHMQPMAEDWRAMCNTGLAFLEIAEEETGDFKRMCERGWQGFEGVKEYQTSYCALRGLECSKISLE